jgi:V8-like Glu-specific endopeptidase
MELRDKKNPWAWSCSAVLITKTKVLTADHCLWMYKPADRVFDDDGERDKKQEASPTLV